MKPLSGYFRCFCPNKARILGVCGFFLCAALNIASQERALIYHVQGDDFAITLRDERTVFPAGAAQEAGVNLERTGIVHTGAGTFLELQLLPSGTVIKLSENSSLVYNGFDENGSFVDLGLLYGRLRLVTNSGGINSVVVRSGAVSARIERGDLGVDYILDPNNQSSSPRPLFRLCAFRGSAEVFPYGRTGATAFFGAVQSLSANTGECLSLDISSSYTFAEKKPLGDDIVDYWIHNSFIGISPQPMPNTTLSALRPPAEAIPIEVSPLPLEAAAITAAPREEPVVRSSNRKKNALLSIGLVMTAGSAAAQGYFNYNNDKRLVTATYGPLGMGLLFTLFGIFAKPQLE